jgi:hypothetical protein
MISKEEHKIKNSITDVSSRYFLVNKFILQAYQGIPSGTWSKLASYLFTLICSSIRYEKGNIKPGYDFIYNPVPVTVDGILAEIRSVAYAEGSKLENDRRNYRKNLADLHKNNIFYMWKCGKFYIFIMERELRSWICYNKGGCVTPKTILKIIRRSRSMINNMIKSHKDGGSNFSVVKIESSFGVFINTMIDKMNPLIAAEDLPRWDKKQHIHKYLGSLYNALENLEQFDGLVEDDKYNQRLPLSVREYLSNKVNRGVIMNSNLDLEKEIAPTGDDANVGKKPRKKRAKKVAENKNPQPAKPKKRRFNHSLNPFAGGPSFTKYYHAFLEQLASNTQFKFDDIVADNRVAVEILDLLRESSLDNKEFINDWITYFYENSLKGKKAIKPEYTSLRAFRYTFERYKDTHYIPQ